MAASKCGILLCEGLWESDQVESDKRESISPVISYICKINDAKFSRFDIGTIAELKHRLIDTNKKHFGTLYFAFHGRTGGIWIENQLLSLEELAEIMGDQFWNWNIHFGSCSVAADEDRLLEFKKKVGARIVSSYNIPADWIDSASLEIAWLSALINGRRTFPKYYKSLAKKCGLVIV